MKITKKVCIYILVGLITITGTFTSFYKGVYAFEYVGGALAFEEAIKWLLASVGIISAGGMTADYWENHSQEFEDYCTQQNITDTEVANWQFKLCQGILDKGSECWQAFKAWASSLVSGSSTSNGTVNSIVSDLVPNIHGLNDYSTFSFDQAVYMTYSNGYVGKIMFFSGYTSYDLRNRRLDLVGTSSSTFLQIGLSSSGNGSINYQTSSTGSITVSFDDFSSMYFYGFGSNADLKALNTSYNEWIIDGLSGSTDDSLQAVQSDVTDLDIISSPIPDTDAQEVAIPMPGVADSDNEASAEAYDNIVDQVNDGTLELDDAITQIIDTLKIIVYEQETEKIFPKPENEEDQEDLDDKINQNKDNMGFTLGGLETVFPFCIPWDIYAFINLLRADPVPPKVELPFPNPLDPENPWTVEVDFSEWDDGMRIVRLAEDFLFIIGLAVLTRSLIGAGGGDG